MNKETNMTKFDKSKFSYHGGYLMYGDKFIARFKHRGPVTKGIFLKQLIKNHTVEEYLRKNANGMGIAPLTILKEADPKWYNSVLEAYQAKIQAKYGIRPIKFL